MSPSNLKQRGRTWYVRVGINPKFWEAIGRREVVRSLQTKDRRKAERLKHGAIVEIRKEIENMILASEAAEVPPSDPRWLKAAARSIRASVASGEIEQDLASRMIEELREQHYQAAGLMPAPSVLHSDLPDDVPVKDYAVAANRLVNDPEFMPLSEAVTDYLNSIESRVQKSTYSAKQKRLDDLKAWAGPDIAIADITRRMASQYVSDRLVRNGRANKTNRDHVATLSTFFRYLIDSGRLEGSNPFTRQMGQLEDSKRGTTDTSYRAWTDDELTKMFDTLKSKPEGTMLRRAYDVARISLYSGMRLDEIAALRMKEVRLDDGYFAVRKGKTDAAVRQVPIHPAIRQDVTRLIAGRQTGYLIRGLNAVGEDKKRSHSLGNRFSALKNKLFPDAGRTLAFHGLRSTFLTALEEKKVPVTTAELLVGHRRQSLSYGLYSKGLELEGLQEAIKDITFPV